MSKFLFRACPYYFIISLDMFQFLHKMRLVFIHCKYHLLAHRVKKYYSVCEEVEIAHLGRHHSSFPVIHKVGNVDIFVQL